MHPSVSVWTSVSTALVQNQVAKIVRADSESDCYDSLDLANCSVAEITEKLNNAFNRLVNMTMSDPTLHILAIIPLYEEDSKEQVLRLYDACTQMEHSITLHILGLASGIRPVLNDETEEEKSLLNLDLLRKLCSESRLTLSYSLIDDYASNGAPIGFTVDSLARYIALFQIALIEDYYQILPTALLTGNTGDNLSIGLSSLSFRRDHASRQLLGLAFLEALDYVGINNKEVNAQKALHEAEQILEGIVHRYPQFFDKSIRPLYTDGGLDQGHAVAEASALLEVEIAELKDHVLALLTDDSLSLPEKEAVLASLLGRDNENLTGMQYDHESTLLDDVCDEPINLYVNAFNKFCHNTTLLPVRGDFKDLKQYVRNPLTGEIEESPQNLLALNPLKEIKRLKMDILNSTSFIRDKQTELEDISKTSQKRKDAEEIKIRWRRPKGAFKDIEYKEQPLENLYVPSPDLAIKKSVDLRKFFTPVKNQMYLGSCTSFAAVAMYEAMMARAGVEGLHDMSPAYLYYYSNVLKGRPDGGSNFFEQLEVLGSKGVCHEDLYPYAPDEPDEKPSLSAEEDAKYHRVLSAKQISLIDGSDKTETLKSNHELLTSALSEGYPIGISLKVFENLGRDGAFVLHPDDTPNVKEYGLHAMVLVGYSEENSFYIVRNSWGPEFGEDGYCYIPTAYIDDPEYLNFACIITEISDDAKDAKVEIPTVLANFAATETEIRAAAIRNAIAKIRVDLRSSQKLYAEYYKYYQKLVLHLTMPKTQKEIREAAEEALAEQLCKTRKLKQNLEETFVAKNKEYKKSLLKVILSSIATSLGLGIGFYLSKSGVVGLMFIVSVILLIFILIGYKWWKRIKRRSLQEELEQVALTEHRQEKDLLETQIRFHVAGMWLSKFHKLSLELEKVYDRLVSYNGSLRKWQESYTRQIGTAKKPEGQMFRELDASPKLKDFFEWNKKEIVSRIDLIRVFKDYQISTSDIETYHQNLRDAVSSVISALMENFNIVNFLLGDEYPYLQPVSMENELSVLMSVGQPSYKNKALNASAPIRHLISHMQQTRMNQWKNKTNPLFPMLPNYLHHSDPTSIILITIHPQ